MTPSASPAQKTIESTWLHTKQVHTRFLETRIIPYLGLLGQDDFRVKYVGKEHADHMIAVMTEHYKISEDWEGTKYCGVTFNWDSKKWEVHISIKLLGKREHHSYSRMLPAYSVKIQYTKKSVISP